MKVAPGKAFFDWKLKMHQNLPPLPPWERPEEEWWMEEPPELPLFWGRAVRLTFR